MKVHKTFLDEKKKLLEAVVAWVILICAGVLQHFPADALQYFVSNNFRNFHMAEHLQGCW